VENLQMAEAWRDMRQLCACLHKKYFSILNLRQSTQRGQLADDKQATTTHEVVFLFCCVYFDTQSMLTEFVCRINGRSVLKEWLSLMIRVLLALAFGGRPRNRPSSQTSQAVYVRMT
jgi:hypothetical protein